MIEREKAEFLVSLISNETEPLNKLYERFCTDLDSSTQFFCISSLSYLLQSNYLSPKNQIISLWILSRESKNTSIEDNPFSLVYKTILENKETKPIISQIVIAILTNNSSLKSLSNKSTSQILNEKFSLSKTPLVLDKEISNYFSQMDTETNTFIPSLISVENSLENLTDQQIISNDNFLVMLLSSNYLFQTPKFGPESETPPIYPITNQELEYSYVDSFDISPMFDDAKRTMIYEPIESIIRRMETDILKEREVNIVLDNIKKDPSLFSFIFDESEEAIQKMKRIINKNLSAAKKIYCYFALNDQRIFDMLLHFSIENNLMSIMESVILQGTFPSNFVESFVDIVLEKMRKMKDTKTRDKNVAIICNLMCNLHNNKVQFSDYIVCELRDFCEEEKFNHIAESQELLTLIADE